MDIVKNPVTSINNTELKAVQVYPNPVVNFLNIDAVSGQNKLLVYNNSGQKLLEISLSNGKNHIDVANLKQGTYLIKVTGTIDEFRTLLIKK